MKSSEVAHITSLYKHDMLLTSLVTYNNIYILSNFLRLLIIGFKSLIFIIRASYITHRLTYLTNHSQLHGQNPTSKTFGANIST